MSTTAPPFQRPTPTSDPRFGPFVLEVAAGRLLREGRAVELAPKPFAVLAFLAARPHALVSKDELLDGVWGHRYVSESALKVAINSLRQALGDDARTPRWIHTVARRGYRFSDEPQAHDADPDPPPPAAAPARGNLPAAGEALLGRDEALLAVQAALKSHRLVTITGPGGVGKTRLALAAAGYEPPADGVWLLRLETLAGDGVLDSAFVPALARTLGLSEAAGRDAAAMARALAPLRLRLLLDNAEHVADALAPALQTWLQAAPGLQILVTSQRPLRLAGEQLLPLPPLAPGAAVALLVQRVQAAAPQWVPDADALADVAAIARGLDGLPLALELAAARVPLLGAAGVRQRLDTRLRMLTRGANDAPSRHRTLRAALEWSIALLPDAAVRVLERLSVFAGGFTLPAACAVAEDALPGADEWAAIDALDTLRDMALVVHTGPRLRLYDSVRLLAAERLAARGDEPAAQAAHMAWLSQVFGEAQQQVLSLSEEDWLAPLEPELENLQAAMGRGLAAAAGDAGRLPAVAALFSAIPVFCTRVGLRRQMLAWLLALREQLGTAGARPLAPEQQVLLDAAVALVASPGQLIPPAEGLAALQRALADGGDGLRPELRLYLLYHQGQLQNRLNQVAELEETRQRAAQLLRPDASIHARRVLDWLGALQAINRNEVQQWGDFFAQMLAESRQRGDHLEGWKAAWGLAQSLYLRDHVDAAIECLDQAVDEIRAAGLLQRFGTLLAQGAMLRLARDASPSTLQRVREAVQVLQVDGMVWWLADALAWAPLWQGSTAEALRVQAWADGLVAARNEHRGPVFSRLRAAFAARTAGQTAPADPALDEAGALRLALGAGPGVLK